ncbi:hypothetical protein OAK19_00280 [Aureispira]|nr:hypothetical protein [Aureispira sp.]
MTTEKISIIIPSPKKQLVPTKHMESKYIIEMNKHLIDKETKLCKKLQEVQNEKDQFEEEIDKYEKSTQYMRGLLKNFVEINKTNKKIDAEYQKLCKCQEQQFIRLRIFIIFVVLFSIFSHFFFYYGITLFIASLFVYMSIKDIIPHDYYKKNIKTLKKEIIKIDNACDFLTDYIDNL